MKAKDCHDEKVLILDFGSQYTQLIARRIRKLNVFCEIKPFDITDGEITSYNPNAIILSGGPESTLDENSPRVSQVVFDLRVPVLGICYGFQTMVIQLGGMVEEHDKKEFGHVQIESSTPSSLLDGIFSSEGLNSIWMSHGDQVSKLPSTWKATAKSSTCPFAAAEDHINHLYGLQFHPEVTHSKGGLTILSNFLFKIAGLNGLWETPSIAESIIRDLKKQLGTAKVILGISGGVDSSVAGALLSSAIGPNLTPIFVDNGLLRKHEADAVMTLFKEKFHIEVLKVDAKDEFMSALEGQSDPEDKRKTVGRVFIDVFEREAKKLGSEYTFLAQGTIYPDVIESAGAASGKAHCIKSHHNVAGLPERMHLKVCEPLRELFKDEVRRIGLAMGIHPELIGRHPFPGPGLAVRICGAVDQKKADILREADDIFIHELRAADLYHETAQAFAVLTDTYSVGVTGDGRRYAPVVALRAVCTVDFMTATWARLPYDFLEKVSNRIVNECAGVSRVVYDVTGKPPGTIEWE